MARRYRAPFNGKRFIGNASPSKMEVHDLDIEDTGQNGCQIDEIKDVKTFIPDTLEQAHNEEFDNCAKCIGGSKR